ncbi:hypothetical protein NECAME_17173 [Necator americanus]|nr:hypothetical protein NECAME_17173 [Necator americanus]ETN84284.1 hypothetical protein NECAME_17173 [Necator americanus]
MMRLLAFVRCSLLVRILVDPILSFITDFQIRRGFLVLLGIHRKLTFTSSRIFQKSTCSDVSTADNNAIEQTSRSHTVSTVSCPTAMKF